MSIAIHETVVILETVGVRRHRIFLADRLRCIELCRRAPRRGPAPPYDGDDDCDNASWPGASIAAMVLVVVMAMLAAFRR